MPKYVSYDEMMEILDNKYLLPFRKDERLRGLNGIEIVRCKDCKWYRIAPIDNVPYCCHESGYCGEHMKGLFFCACGERKDT